VRRSPFLYSDLSARWARPRRGAILALLSALALGALLPAPGAAAQDHSQGDFFVPVGKRTGFGPFEESRNSAAALRHAFGAPSSERLGPYGFSCIVSWPDLSIVVELVAFGDAGYPCDEGVFVSARLTDPRWHTASGVRPGGGKGVARRAAVRRCSHDTIGCGITGYALELHRTDCAASLTAGVIAHTRGARVESLIVRWRGCE
jgi:hypothetical protein